MWYSIKALDKDGDELRTRDDVASKKKEAIRQAREMVNDQELKDAGLDTVQVVDENGECEWDDFV